MRKKRDWGRMVQQAFLELVIRDAAERGEIYILDGNGL